MADDISDRRVRARMSCRFGNCFWTVQTDSASEMERLWREHSATHWEIDASALLPRPLADASAQPSDDSGTVAQ